MTDLFIDIETFSDVDLKKFGVYRYAASPVFSILMAAWALDDGPVEVAVGWDEVSQIPGLNTPGVRQIAHNAQFERICFSAYLCSRGFLPPAEWHDTAAVAGELGYPQKLADLARALGGEQKDEAGTALINYFCKPYRGRQRTAADDPEKWAAFIEYCRQDVVTLRSVHKSLGEFPTTMEWHVYLADQAINDRGMLVDDVLATVAVEAAADNAKSHIAEIQGLAGIENPNSNVQMLEWLRDSGLPMGNLQAETVEKTLALDHLDFAQRRVLELRQELALVAAKKFSTALGAIGDDGRLRGGFRFFGAHTGRWAGRGVQPHNLPRASLASEGDVEAAICDLMLGYGADAHTLKALVRSMFLVHGTVVDYSSIEARVIAWLAGEEWALEAFRKGRDIYVETAARMSTPGNELTRAQGKVAVLALGFQGSVNSLRVMGGEGTDEELLMLVRQWREANPAIKRFWALMESKFRTGGKAGRIVVEKDGNDRLLRLPSGRAITYHNCRWTEVDGPYGPRMRATFDDPAHYGWRADTYGGRLAENVTQAVARDILAEALVRLEDAGLAVVGHVHDEIIVEAEKDVERVRRIMIEPPAWADGLPIDGSGFTCSRYRKD